MLFPSIKHTHRPTHTQSEDVWTITISRSQTSTQTVWSFLHLWVTFCCRCSHRDTLNITISPKRFKPSPLVHWFLSPGHCRFIPAVVTSFHTEHSFLIINTVCLYIIGNRFLSGWVRFTRKPLSSSHHLRRLWLVHWISKSTFRFL